MSKKDFNIAIPGGKYTHDGKEKTKWNIVGACFQNNDGSVSCKLDNNISISNEFVLFKPKPRT